MAQTNTTLQASTDPDQEPTLLGLVMAALQAKRRIPTAMPRTRLPDHFNRDTIKELYVEQRGGGWVANVSFQVPAGLPDTVGSPDAHPYATQLDAFLHGATIVCEIVTGSPELPFTVVGDQLICMAYGPDGE